MSSDLIPAYILSNGCQNDFPDNTLSSFQVRLPLSSTLSNSSNQKWCISLKSIGISTNFKTGQESDYLKNPVIIQFQSRKDNLYYDVNYFNGDSQYENNLKIRTHILFKLQTYLNINKEILKRGQFHYFYNSFLNEDYRIQLINHLKKNDLNVLNESTSRFLSLKNNVIVNRERIFLIRSDVVDLCTISQERNIATFNDTINTFKSSIFKNRDAARTLQNSSLSLDNSSYKIFIINDEFTNLCLSVNKYLTRKNIIPRLIKIKCPNIRKQLHNNEYTNDIEVIKPNFSKKSNGHYFHHLERPIFISLLTNTLNSLKFIITNEYDEPLNLLTGAPTILSVAFKK